MLAFMEYCTSIARHVAKWSITQMCICQIKYQRGGYRTILGECKSDWKGTARHGASHDSNTISCDMGPPSQSAPLSDEEVRLLLI